MGNIREEIIGFMRENGYLPMTEKQLLKRFGNNEEDKKILREVISDLEKEGLIYKTHRNTLGVPEKMGLVVGNLSVNSRGYGFVDAPGEEKGLYISSGSMKGALNGDKVVARLKPRRSRNDKLEGEVIKILERRQSRIVGVYEASKRYGFVVAEDRRITSDIFVAREDSMGAVTGDLVECEITEFSNGKRSHEGKVVAVLGRKGDFQVDYISILKQHHINDEFPKKVLKQVEKIPSEVRENELVDRLDLRDELIYTIDGSDSRDFDDAISISKDDRGNYDLGVHIADVAHYVGENTPLDKEARSRGTSVYLVDKVVPMLPKELSNGICSLNPNVDRLSLSCLMKIDKRGEVIEHRIVESVINSKHRLVYEEVSHLLETIDRQGELSELEANLILAEELQNILFKKRNARGAIEFDFPESKIIVENEAVIDVQVRERKVANEMIEEFMLIANETVAKEYFEKKLPFVYRVHESPDEDKMKDFNTFASNFGIHASVDVKGEVHPKDLQTVLAEVKGKESEDVISKVLLRSMKQARYSPSNDGHFGLAARFYTHFTSPIRRYPDLQIHRIIKMDLHNYLSTKKIEQLRSVVEAASILSSERERNAEDAERSFEELRKAQYMERFIGHTFEGKITSITNFGMFVTLPNTVEGLIRLNTLANDYYTYDEEHLQLIGEHTGKVYKIGMRVEVVLDYVKVDEREIGFSLSEE